MAEDTPLSTGLDAGRLREMEILCWSVPVVELEGELFSFVTVIFNLEKGFGVELLDVAAGVDDRENGCFGVVGFEVSACLFFSSDFGTAGDEVPSLANRLARIWIQGQ